LLLPPPRLTTTLVTSAKVPLPRLEDTDAPPPAVGLTLMLSLPLDRSVMKSVPLR
jgi:hypothetical protein